MLAVVALGVVTVAAGFALNADGTRDPSIVASIFVAVVILLGGPRLLAALPPAGVRRVSAPGFDELIHQSTRLSIVALLAAADWMDFAFIRDELGLSESALSKQLSTLEGGGLRRDRAAGEQPPAAGSRAADVAGPEGVPGARPGAAGDRRTGGRRGRRLSGPGQSESAFARTA